MGHIAGTECVQDIVIFSAFLGKGMHEQDGTRGLFLETLKCRLTISGLIIRITEFINLVDFLNLLDSLRIMPRLLAVDLIFMHRKWLCSEL